MECNEASELGAKEEQNKLDGRYSTCLDARRQHEVF